MILLSSTKRRQAVAALILGKDTTVGGLGFNRRSGMAEADGLTVFFDDGTAVAFAHKAVGISGQRALRVGGWFG
jgi:hypothetical protein